jgi:threonine dehydrogenase-like Zn-dependent dehydrogenase
MWVFTQHGFVSAVQHFDDPTKIVVRSRDKQSLEMASQLFGAEIVNSPRNDYPYRVILERSQFIAFLTTEVELLDYTNFKGRLDSSRGELWHDTASAVWGIMHEIEDDEARDQRTPAFLK